MEETQSKQSKFGKAVLLMILLAVLPGISWYYLRGGLNWRKQAVAELADYGQIRAAWNILPDGKQVDQLKGKVCAIRLFGENPDLTPGNKATLDVFTALFSQFGTNDAFRICSVWEGGTAEFRSYYQKIDGVDYVTWVYTGGLGGWRTILENAYESFYLHDKSKPVPDYVALTDTDGRIRRFYDAADPEQVKRLIQHIAILLPNSPK